MRTLFWVLLLDKPEDFHLFHALYGIFAMICDRLKHGLSHEKKIKLKQQKHNFFIKQIASDVFGQIDYIEK